MESRDIDGDSVAAAIEVTNVDGRQYQKFTIIVHFGASTFTLFKPSIPTATIPSISLPILSTPTRLSLHHLVYKVRVA